MSKLTPSNKNYVSEIDQFLEEVDKKVQKSANQQQEINKFKTLNHLRDHSDPQVSNDTLWEDF